MQTVIDLTSSNLESRIRSALNKALKDRSSKQEKSTLRLIIAALKELEIHNRVAGESQPLSNDDVMKILSKMRQQRILSLKLYEDAGRIDLVNQENEELKVINSFMPHQLADLELERVCAKTIEKLQACGLKDMGNIMSVLKSDYAHTIDFGRAGAISKRLLQEKMNRS